ncbi:cytochrome P450 71A1 [Manihot esculenta]|uniref:Cytochrome P450 n=1 Tax=Manihot esculenta TaxID=3983 RepID=A0A2C9UXR2_MANES|nr:cytochrome P450 71A1 [Manihot esculenta]OAY35952.1 hypothetical protein MANES_12G143900v8 [Manihot esculenta]
MVSFVFLALAVPVLLLLLFQNRKTKTNPDFPPGPRALPFVGNLHQLHNSASYISLWKLSQKYGPLMSLRMCFEPVLVVSSAKMAKEIMKTHDHIFSARPSKLSQQKLSYNGLDLAFAAYGSYWKEMKKICKVHLFNSNRARSFRPIRESEVSHMLGEICGLVSASQPVDINEAIMSLANTIISKITFGQRYKEENSRIQALLREAETLFTSFFVSDYFPLLGFVDKLTGLIHRLEKNFQEFDIFYEKIIQEHLDYGRSELDDHSEDILDGLLKLRNDPSLKFQVTFSHIKAVLMNIVTGATDNNAAAVIWAMTFLMKNPTKMKKAQEEVRGLFGNKGFVNEDEVQKLSYLKAVMKETMRLQPTLPIIPRETTEDCNLDGFKIPAKTTVYVNVYAIGRDPQVWENAQEFCPERFINSSVDLKGQNFELIPFGGGRRMCPGVSIALATVELAFANLLYKFDWEMPFGMSNEDLDMEVVPGLTMHKKNALCLMAKQYI